MYCRHCGNELREGALFCTRCGKGVDVLPQAMVERSQSAASMPYSSPSVNDASSSLAPSEHPYKRFGGFLAYIAISAYVSGALMAIFTVVIGFTLSTLSSVARTYPYASSTVQQYVPFLFFLMIIGIVATAYLIYFGTLIVKRNPSFLKAFQIYCIAVIVIVIILTVLAAVSANMLSPYMSYVTDPSTTARVANVSFSFVATIVSSVVGVILTNLYFVKSVRVRTYFGSDEYLRQSLFTRNVQAPEPAVAD